MLGRLWSTSRSSPAVAMAARTRARRPSYSAAENASSCAAWPINALPVIPASSPSWYGTADQAGIPGAPFHRHAITAARAGIAAAGAQVGRPRQHGLAVSERDLVGDRAALVGNVLHRAGNPIDEAAAVGRRQPQTLRPDRDLGHRT